FAGEGKRPVRVGYVVENPVWKTSYRLVLGKDGKPFLQGWAVVENPSDEDWQDVRMALGSGRPVSLQMGLYQPLSVPRTMFEPEPFAALRQANDPVAMHDPAAGARGPGGGAGFAGGMPSGAAGLYAQHGLRRAAEKAEALGRDADKKATYAFAAELGDMN